MEIAWLDIADDADAWEAAGFSVTTSGDGPATCVVGRVEHRLWGTETGRRGVFGWAVTGLHDLSPAGPDRGRADIDGIPTAVVEGHEVADGGEHPNGVFRIDHLVIRTNNTPRTVDALTGVGLERRGHRDTNSAGDAVDMTFFWAGDTLLELAGPPEPSPDPKPSRLAGIAFSCHDLDAAARLLGDRLTTPRDAVQPGRRISALTRQAGCTTPIALMTPHVRTEGGGT